MASVRLSYNSIARSVPVVIMVFLLWAQIASADTTPAVVMFNASPSSIGNDYSEALSWTTTNATGVDLYIACPTGVTLVSSTGGSFPCNTRQAAPSSGTTNALFVVTNLSGASQTIVATAYPQDSTGTDYDPGAMSASFTVGTSAQPITNVSLSTTTTSSNTPIVLTWTGIDTPGANIQFDCVPNVQIFATNPSIPGNIPCGSLAFSPDLAQSGSITFSVANTSLWPVIVTAHVVPLIAPGLHDMTHSVPATVTVAPVPPMVAPTVTGFSSSPSTITSGVPFVLSWTTLNATGANIQFSCNPETTSIASVSGTTTSAVPCNTPMFPSALSTAGSTTVEVTLQNPGPGAIAVALLPEGTNGTYYGTTARTLDLSILPISSAPPAAQVVTHAPGTVTTTSTTSSPHSLAHYTFTLALHRGSSNVDVTALQTYLAQYPNIYPPGLVTGYFGPATQQAVELFQVAHGIVGQGGPGYGLVGPKTRALLNTLQ